MNAETTTIVELFNALEAGLDATLATSGRNDVQIHINPPKTSYRSLRLTRVGEPDGSQRYYASASITARVDINLSTPPKPSY